MLSASVHSNNSDVTGLDGNQQAQNTTVDATEKEPGLSESRLSGQAEAQSRPDQCVTHKKSTTTRTAEASGPQTGNAIGYEMEHHVMVELHLSQNDLDGLDDGAHEQQRLHPVVDAFRERVNKRLLTRAFHDLRRSLVARRAATSSVIQSHVVVTSQDW